MSPIKNSFFAVSALLVLFISGTGSAQQQAKKATAAADVNIVNTPSVQVTNTPGVRDLDNPARQPVQATKNCSADDVVGCQANIYTVPQGKRLVIEYVSMEANINAGQVAQAELQTTAGGELAVHRFPTTPPAIAFSGQGAATLGQGGRFYADPGDVVILTGSRNISTGTALFRFTISGHLVDVP